VKQLQCPPNEGLRRSPAGLRRSAAVKGGNRKHTAAYADRLPVLLDMAEVKHVEQITDGWHVDRDIRIIVDNRIRQVVTAALRERTEIPVVLDEFHERGVLGTDVTNVAAPLRRRRFPPPRNPPNPLAHNLH